MVSEAPPPAPVPPLFPKPLIRPALLVVLTWGCRVALVGWDAREEDEYLCETWLGLRLRGWGSSELGHPSHGCIQARDEGGIQAGREAPELHPEGNSSCFPSFVYLIQFL